MHIYSALYLFQTVVSTCVLDPHNVSICSDCRASTDTYRTCLARAKRALTSGTFPAATLALIDEDMLTTLPSLHIFHRETGPMYADLRDMLLAWVVSRSDEGLGYTLGAAKIAAMLLLNMPSQQAFVVMRNLLERHCMRSFFGGEGTREDVRPFCICPLTLTHVPRSPG